MALQPPPQKGQEAVKLSTERKHLTNILRMVAYQMESDLVELVRPHYKRVEDEGQKTDRFPKNHVRRSELSPLVWWLIDINRHTSR